MVLLTREHTDANTPPSSSTGRSTAPFCHGMLTTVRGIGGSSHFSSRYTSGPGMSVWRSPALGAFEDPRVPTNEYSAVAIGLAPNPVECLWVGPRMSDFDCSTCVLGYERDLTATVPTCLWPNSFKVHNGWSGSSAQALLRLRDTRGKEPEQYLITGGGIAAATTTTSKLLTEHTYAIIMKRLPCRYLVCIEDPDQMGCRGPHPVRAFSSRLLASLPPPFMLTCVLWMATPHIPLGTRSRRRSWSPKSECLQATANLSPGSITNSTFHWARK